MTDKPQKSNAVFKHVTPIQGAGDKTSCTISNSEIDHPAVDVSITHAL